MKKRIHKVSTYLLPFRTVLVFFAGFFLALAIIFKIDADYTEDLFQQLGKHILAEARVHHDTEKKTILRAMNTTYLLQLNSKNNLFTYQQQSFKGKYMRSTDLDLLDVSGACGSASMVLARTLHSMGFPIRIGQMYVNGNFGGHIIVEVWSNGRWMVLDPLFNQGFVKPDGNLASFKDVQNNFAYYSKQIHPSTPKEYQYQDIRYTNWEKIPLLSPVAKKLLDLVYGEARANEICLRKYLIKFYLILHYVFLSLFVTSAGILLYQNRIKRNRFLSTI
jgi:hypothetical protein